MKRQFPCRSKCTNFPISSLWVLGWFLNSQSFQNLKCSKAPTWKLSNFGKLSWIPFSGYHEKERSQHLELARPSLTLGEVKRQEWSLIYFLFTRRSGVGFGYLFALTTQFVVSLAAKLWRPFKSVLCALISSDLSCLQIRLHSSSSPSTEWFLSLEKLGNHCIHQNI